MFLVSWFLSFLGFWLCFVDLCFRNQFCFVVYDTMTALDTS